MRYRKNNDIIDFFNVSIVLPFYKRLDDFKKVLLKNAHYFQRNGIEVVIVLDEPSEEHGLINFVTNFPFISFKIIINREAHPWRNPSKVINVGIKHASFDYILVMSPETELYTDVIYQLRYALYHYPSSYATGVVSFISHDDEVDKIQNVSWLPYGSIMVAKTDLLEVFGYNENHDAWGGEDDQIRRQLDLLGLTKIELPDAKNVHREKKSDGHKDRSSRINEMPIRHLKNIFYPKQADLNYKPWGQDFNEVIWCWNTHKDLSQLKEFMEMFPASSIMNNQICNYDFGIIALIQVRNESKNILEILPHLDKYCDGIILLDDGSVDGSYELAQHEKLLLKVQKKYKGYFDDLENRNDLLRLASFIKSKWFFFIDADERFDNRYCDIRKYLNDENCDVYRFHLVDLWDNPETYRIDIPDRRANGIATRARMFKNKGSMQIYTNREIHFPTVPYSKSMQLIKILLLHYGNFDKKIRERKYKLYKSQDPDEKKQAHSYDFLRDENVVLGRLKSLKLIN